MRAPRFSCDVRLRPDSLDAGFGNIRYFGAYNHSVALGASDRLVAVAQLSDDAA
jgi:hypothetical protein